MTAEQFIELVRKMRECQNAYYKNGRKQSDLIDSKQLEKEVDRALLAGISFPVEGVLTETNGTMQPLLFAEDGNDGSSKEG